MNRFVVVGGGSAGWMTASILIKTFPEKEVILVESDSIPRVGVGESTYEGINYYLEYLGIDRNSFFNYTNASVKLAIQFKNFYKENNEPEFIYPFGSAVIDGTYGGLDDWMIRKNIQKDIPVTDFAESYFPAAHLVKHNKLSDNENQEIPNFNPVLNTALHFDATRFAEWLKVHYCLPRGVKHIIGTVTSIKSNDDGIEYLVLDNDNKITSDLFIDCTGFQSLLLDKTMKEEFISYTDILPNNSAWATQLTYKEPNIEVENVTRCTALKNGWCWNIPLFSRLGAGYVYSDKHTTDIEALKEFKEYLKNDLKIKRSEEDIENLKFKNIKMRVGIHNRVWVKNVVAIGLSAGFIEPLESNGLFTVHEFLFYLIKSLQRDKISQWDRDVFNDAARMKFDQFVEFIRLHYALSLRDDSSYWKDNLNRKYDLKPRNNFANHLEFVKHSKMHKPQNPPHGGIAWISAGMEYYLFDGIAQSLQDIAEGKIDQDSLQNSFNLLDNKKDIWNNYALGCESSYNYLRRKYHND